MEVVWAINMESVVGGCGEEGLALEMDVEGSLRERREGVGELVRAGW